MLQDSDECSMPLTFGQMADNVSLATASRWIDCDTAVLNFALSHHGATERSARKPLVTSPIVPVVFSPWEKTSLSDELFLCFGALALSQSTGVLSEIGTLLFGDNLRRKTVRFPDQAEQLNQIINTIGSLFSEAKNPNAS